MKVRGTARDEVNAHLDQVAIDDAEFEEDLDCRYADEVERSNADAEKEREQKFVEICIQADKEGWTREEWSNALLEAGMYTALELQDMEPLKIWELELLGYPDLNN